MVQTLPALNFFYRMASAAVSAAALASSATRSLSHCLSCRASLAGGNTLRLLEASGVPCSRVRDSVPFTTAAVAAGLSSGSGSGSPLGLSRIGDGAPSVRSLRKGSDGSNGIAPFRGKVFVSYSSPDGTPFYYPGSGFADLGIGPEKLLQPGDPDTYQVKIRDVMPVGYFVDMPSGREGYLPANDLGFSGGIERLRTIFQVGQEVTVRITFRGGGGRELLSIRKYDPERPPIEPPKVARSSGSGKHKISSMMRRRAQQQRS